MDDRVKPSWAIRVFGPLIFVLGSIAAFLWFFYRAYSIFIGELAEVVVFDKGSFYMLGVGAGMLILAFVTVQEGWLDRQLSQAQSTFLTRLAVISVVLIITVPHTIHYFADDYLESEGYSVCQDASHQWLFVRNIVYVHEPVSCNENLIKN
ncbi:MAG: hypothetical protein JKY50_11895 [Oleispira sp.]|nr:hypothetical protein [Oleispira sp.]MBL4881128.1 hypothetical protein [Oleispira sp.]